MNLCTNAAHAMDGRGTLEVALDTVAVPRERALSHGTLRAGRLCAACGARHRPRHGCRHAAAHLRAVLHDQAGRRRHRPRPADRARHRDPARRGVERGEPARRAAACFEAFWPQTRGARGRGRHAPAHAAPQGNGETVLLVDDEAALVLLGEEMLAALGYEPVGFEASRAALAAFRADPGRFDLALLDEIMPEMTGQRARGGAARNPPRPADRADDRLPRRRPRRPPAARRARCWRSRCAPPRSPTALRATSPRRPAGRGPR